MKNKLLIIGLVMTAFFTSCYGPDDSVYTDELDVVYTQKQSGYDFNTKSNYYVSDTITFFDSKGKVQKSPDENGDYLDEVPKSDVDAYVNNIKNNMNGFGWNYVSASDIAGDPSAYKANTVLMNIVLSKTTYVGGGYYPGWGWGYYPGYWYPYYYSYSTGSVIVNMFEVAASPVKPEQTLNMIWEDFLSGYIRNGIKVSYINKAITQGFDQSADYLDKTKPAPAI